MARGGKRGHKGGARKFTNPEALKQQMEKEEKEREWRRQKGYESESSEEDDQSGQEEKSDESDDDGGIKFDRSGDGAKAGPSKKSGKKRETSSEESSEESDDDEKKRKGVEGLIEIENPNLRPAREKKVSQLDSGKSAKPQLSRREREEVEKQKAKAHYQKLHAAGKTDEAKADLARLAIIRKQREEAAKKREAEAQAKLEAAKAKQDATDKALGKRGKK